MKKQYYLLLLFIILWSSVSFRMHRKKTGSKPEVVQEVRLQLCQLKLPVVNRK